ncbi:uncharacterized protein PHALS_09631 [Plasmopara halstedii]|uniref:Uncharacterized protein n=1 Tax=Plasmopara halstedii TaxID=4781 RepID=A0A0P1AG09_PLAHL|nr:uncharacterized protein PHALS_09631 [Plasmopara halstedii]CEG39380.1 hypothetical protein PHALS_09631 [Plasmopara halstedii]|eukprot:XP_024575749.1 hypothetical protein PHALS_09631 [Plasmopara halstedii]
MDNIEVSLRLIAAITHEQLASDSIDEAIQAMTRVLAYLNLQHVDSLQQTNTQIKSLLIQIEQTFHQWHKLQQSIDKAMNFRLWILWVELGCTLAVLYWCKTRQMKNCFQLVANTKPPTNFPTLESNFHREEQVAFICNLWNAVIANPLAKVPAKVVEEMMPELAEVFFHWMTVAMRGYETIYIAHVATRFLDHVNMVLMDSMQLENALVIVATCKLKTENLNQNAALISVATLILSALNRTHRNPEATKCLEILSAATVEELSHRPFPEPQNPTASVALALGIAYLDETRHSIVSEMSGNATLLCQFALLRLVSFQLLSSQLKPYDVGAIMDYQARLQQRLKTMILESSHADLQEYSLRQVEISIEDMIDFLCSSRQIYLALLDALKKLLSPSLFLSITSNQLQSTADHSVQDEHRLPPGSKIVAFIQRFYEAVAPLLEVLSNRYIVRSFLALSRMEFAREICASPSVNVPMQAVTKQLELELEQSPSTSDSIFAPIFQSHTARHHIIIPAEMDVIAGCQTLAIGLMVQRKLRILLFHCASLSDDVLTLIFSGLYNVFEPVDAFAHRFLNVCLLHLHQFFPLYSVFPHYLKKTLDAYPIAASRQALTKVCGTIFGSLFDSEAFTKLAKQDTVSTKIAQQMTLWAIRKCCDRCNELFIKENGLSPSSGVGSDESSEQNQFPTKVTTTLTVANSTRESDALYLANLVFELLKMAPVVILKVCAMEVEQLIAYWVDNLSILRQLKNALFATISQDCEAEKRAWLAAWYIEIDRQYPIASQAAGKSRL